MKFLEYFFGRKKTTAELLRDNKRVLNRAIRELDREGHRLEQQELKTILDMKRDAKQGQMVSCFEISTFKLVSRVPCAF